MKITCQSCQSKYTVSDDKVQGRTVKIKCRKCGATILVNSSGVTANGGIADPVSAASGPSDGSTFLVNVADGDQRSMTLAEIVSSYQGAVINADTFVWADGMADWQPLGQVDAIIAALSSGIASTHASAAEPVAAQSAYAGGAAHAHPASVDVASAPRAAVRRDPARPTQDLFGGGQGQEPHRGSIDDVATSAPLFSSGAASGQRVENSMLFSLSALTAKAGTPGAGGAAPTASGLPDDSGLIDLKALAAGGGSPSPMASMVADDGGLFQLSAPIVTSAPTPAAISIEEPAPKNRAPMIIGLGVAIAGIVITGVFVMMKEGSEPPPVTVTAPTQTVAATAPPEPAPPPTAEAVATASPSASASAAPGIVRVGGLRNNAGLGRSTGTGAGTTKAQPAPATAAPATAAPAKRNNCGCAPSDLMCAMQCSAKGK